MTKLLIALCCAASAIGQTSASLSVTGVPAASIMVSAEATSSINIAALADTATNGALATTATATATTTATTIAVASVTSVTTGMGVLIDGEASLITTISGLNLTVTRTTLGTTASAIGIGDAVVFLNSGDLSTWVKNQVRKIVITTMIQYPGPILATNNTSTASQLSSAVN